MMSSADLFPSLLIANRGEIARRIIRTARRLGVPTVAVYSEADAQSPHVREADRALLIGPPAPRDSYLNVVRILDAARQSGAAAIHPGYGFLSENAQFAQAVLDAGLIWVGPQPAAILAMGRKDAAKRLMAEAGVPVTPGYLGDDQSPEHLRVEAEAIGWPILIKAVAGGGGKGMRRVDAANAFFEALTSARREAMAAFGDDRVLLEKYITTPRHIEVQVFGDTHGNIVHLFERDCSLQRRHQKVIEEAPAPGLDAETRAALCATAVKAARAVDYQGAGTIEFIADASGGLRADRIWFMEMNTRLQVEHPVTEAITGLDLVEWQLRVASGQVLPLSQDQVVMTGHAIEARLYAEDPSTGFLPSTGILRRFVLPTGLRIDSGFEAGGEVTPHYDPMIAKLIAHGETREQAATLLAQGCGSVQAWPVKTNAAFLNQLLREPDFLAGRVETGFIATRLDALIQKPEPDLDAQAVAQVVITTALGDGDASPWCAGSSVGAFRLNAPTLTTARVFVDGKPFDLPVDYTGPSQDLLRDADGGFVLFNQGAPFRLTCEGLDADSAGASVSDGDVRAPMPGRIVSMTASVGDQVEAGVTLAVLEAMKMEHSLTAPFAGEIVEVMAARGDQVAEGSVLVRVTAKA